jgi:hypothetical protein
VDIALSASTAQNQLQTFQTALEQFCAGVLSAYALSTMARSQQELLAALPEKFPEVLHQLMDRLESSALFSEESCSFSQRDLVESIQWWVHQAAQRLASRGQAA